LRSLRSRKWVVVWLPFAVAGSWVSFQLQDPTLHTILQLYFPTLSYTFLRFPMHPKSAPHLTFLHFPTLPTSPALPTPPPT